MIFKNHYPCQCSSTPIGGFTEPWLDKWAVMETLIDTLEESERTRLLAGPFESRSDAETWIKENLK